MSFESYLANEVERHDERRCLRCDDEPVEHDGDLCRECVAAVESEYEEAAGDNDAA